MGPPNVLSIVHYTKADWEWESERASGRMSKEESNYGREERRKSATDRFFVVAALSSSVAVAVAWERPIGRGRLLALSLSLVPRREFLSNSETALDEPLRADADIRVHLVQRRRKRLLGKIETRGHKLRAGMEHTRKKARIERERERERERVILKREKRSSGNGSFVQLFRAARTFSLVKTFQAPLASGNVPSFFFLLTPLFVVPVPHIIKATIASASSCASAMRTSGEERRGADRGPD